MKFIFYTLILYVFLFSSATVYGQKQTKEEQNHHTPKREEEPDPHFSFEELSPAIHCFEDSLEEKTLANALRKGFFTVKIRNFMMLTDNQKGLNDYYANGFGMGLHYKSKNWHGFHMGVGGFFKFNLLSNNLENSRYELDLFDSEDPENHHDLDRLEELYLAYDNKHFAAKIGRFTIHTPYINAQDGRMRPSVQEGLHLQWNPIKKLQFEGAWIWAVSPRSTINFSSVEHSLGIYSQGIRTDGSEADYFEHQHTKGIFSSDILFNLEKVKIHLHNQYVENIFNTSLLSVEYIDLDSIAFSPLFGVQYHYQHKLNNGGNPSSELAYYESQKQAQAFSIRLGVANYKHWFTLNYTRINKDGRFLLPREWGREPFFTFMPRERNEGTGDLHAFSTQYHSFWLHHKISFTLGYGYYNLPSVTNYRLNKYELPSYHQLNIDLRYKFKGYFEGLEIQCLIVRKERVTPQENKKYIFNKNNLTNYNFVLNYHFGK